MQQAIGARGRAIGTPPPRVLPPLLDRRDARRAMMPAILVLSLAVHVAVIAGAALLNRPTMPPPEKDVAVEVVSEMPEARKAAAEQAKLEPAKPEPASPEPASLEPAKSEPAKPEPAKLEPAKPEPNQAAASQTAQPEPAKQELHEAAKQPEPPRPAEPAKPPETPKEAEQAKPEPSELQAMRDELARLQAEQQALEAEASQPAAETPASPLLRGGMQAAAPFAGQAAGTGPLASSFQAIALPQETTDGEGELAGYQAIVFSRLAKAKAVGRQLGIPGSAGVAFAIDEHGALTGLRLAVSSGIAKLDEEALAIVRKAAPFPPPPEGAQRSFEANVNFVVGAGG